MNTFKIVVLYLTVFSVSGLCAKQAAIRVDTQTMSSWAVDRKLFGRFFEHHGGAVYPGIDEQYIVNTSFEEYYRKDKNSPTPLRDHNPWLVFDEVKPVKGVAYPWELFGDTKNQTFELSAPAFNSQVSQKIITSATEQKSGVKQRLALPDYRVGQYRFKLYAKSQAGSSDIEVQLKAYASDKVLSRAACHLTDQWQPFTGTLDLSDDRSPIRHSHRQGIYELVICVKRKGTVLLDQITLYPVDAVDGRWNPETIANLKEAGVTVIRWPGGNFASGYHWRDGVGPIEKRPTRPNLAWGGLENNHIGTDDFLRFCEAADLTPLICIGFDTCTVQEAADWVEYCNGSVDSTWGAVRARNGRPEPYRVNLWQIGNEVYGDYQIGHTNAKDYATRYLDYYHAIKKVDPTVQMMAMGKDPGYQENDDNAWNKTLFSIIGTKMDYLDIHRYVRGIRRRSELKKWDLTLLSEIYLSFSSQYDRIIDSIEALTVRYNAPNVKLAVTEWAQYPSLEHPELPHPFSPANAVFYAGMMNAFIRHGEFVGMSCSHDFSVFTLTKVPWNIPVLPRSDIAKLYSRIDADRLLPIKVDCDTLDMPRDIPQMIRRDKIPYLDAVALSTENKEQIVLFIVNRSLTAEYNVALKLDEMSEKRSVETKTFYAIGDPMIAQTWENPVTSIIDEQKSDINGGEMDIRLPVCSMAKVTLKRVPSDKPIF